MTKVSLILSVILLTAMMVMPLGGNISNEELTSKEVTIGNQVWMTENLNVDKFRNGDPVPQAKTNEEWEKAGENEEPAWCYFDNALNNGDRYGKLYNWYAVNDPRGLAPEGWKIPSDDDWSHLTEFLGGGSVAGKKMKSTVFWADNGSESGNGTNESGFSGLPGGYRSVKGVFREVGVNGFWWSSTECNTFIAWHLNLYYKYGSVYRICLAKAGGFSVRCLKD